jgi:hypothetical protein
MSDEFNMAMVCTSIVDSNDVLIEYDDLIDIQDFLINAGTFTAETAFLRKCEYIQAVNGIVEESGNRRTTLATGSFSVKRQQFLTLFTSWYNLQHIGKEWQSNNKPATAQWVKQRIQAALLPFGISKREMTDIYQLLLVHCSAPDTSVEPLTIVTAEDLNTKTYKRPPFIVSGFLCAGLTILAAPPKTGKSFLALDLACCIAEGKPFWGFETTKGDVLYCDLEGTEWRTQERLPSVGRAACPSCLSMVYKVNPVDAGLIAQLTGWIDQANDPRLIIIDTLAHVKGRVARGEDAYSADTRFMKPLHDLAVGRGIAIVAITHTRKANGFVLDDPFDAVIGSTAQYGNSDAGWIIGGKRTDDKKQFTAVGRDFEPVSFEIERTSGGRWVCNGTTEAVQERTEKQEYQANETVGFIKKKVVDCGGIWRCSAQEFITQGALATGHYLAPDAIRMSKKIKELAPLLLKYDEIVVSLPEGSGRKGRIFTFEQKRFTA